MKYFYIALYAEQDRNARLFTDRPSEEYDPGYYATVMRVSTNDNNNYIDIPQVIFLLRYDIPATRIDYWSARRYVREAAVEICEKYILKKTEDRIEDYGEHFYFVFSARRWKNENNPAQKGV